MVLAPRRARATPTWSSLPWCPWPGVPALSERPALPRGVGPSGRAGSSRHRARRDRQRSHTRTQSPQGAGPATRVLPDRAEHVMKIATWNVNGIRARAGQVQEWMNRELPDVVCLQELKAERAQVPEALE